MTFDELFAITPAGDHRWIAPAAPEDERPRLFGGVLLGQAIVAASHGTRRCHALHALFLGAGRPRTAFDISVDATRDGRAFSTRRVEIRERQRLLFTAYSSHHDGENGPEHQIIMPDMESPEALPDRLTRPLPAGDSTTPPKPHITEHMLEVRRIDSPTHMQGTEGRAMWFRSRQQILGGPAIHQAAVAFASDMGLVHVGLQPHKRRIDEANPIESASLDHSIWFHRHTAADDWMLMIQRSPTATHGRGFSDAHIFARDGRLIATVAQSFLARWKNR